MAYRLSIVAGLRMLPALDENQRIVFWNDPDMEFFITLSMLNFPLGVNILRLDQMSALEAKIREKRDIYEALLSNLGIKGVEISNETVRRYEKLLAGGIWPIIFMEYFYNSYRVMTPCSFTAGSLWN